MALSATTARSCKYYFMYDVKEVDPSEWSSLPWVAEGEEEIGSPHFPQIVRWPDVRAALRRRVFM